MQRWTECNVRFPFSAKGVNGRYTYKLTLAEQLVHERLHGKTVVCVAVDVGANVRYVE